MAERDRYASDEINTLTREKRDALIATAKRANAEYRRLLTRFISVNQKLLRTDDDAQYVGDGPVRFAVFLFLAELSFSIAFDNPPGTLAFSGTSSNIGGTSGVIGLGAWAGGGAAAFSLSPDQLLPNGTVVVGAVGAEANGFMLQVYGSDGVLYGTITGVAVGAGVGAGSVLGNYSWSGS